MTKLQIISRLWSHVTDLRMLIREQSKKTLEEIESELDATEYYCRPYADVDDIEAYLEGGEDMEDVISRAEHEEFRKSTDVLSYWKKIQSRSTLLRFQLKSWHRVLSLWLGNRSNRGNVWKPWRTGTGKCGEK